MRSRRVGVVAIIVAVVTLIGLGAASLAVNMNVLAGSSPSPAATGATDVTIAPAGPANTLTVVGAGSATATPDTAKLSLGASATRPNVHDALSADNRDMQNLLGALHGQGVQDTDIQTQSVSVYQATTCCPAVVTGYTATNNVTVTVHHLQNVSAVIAAVVDAVGNDVQLGGVTLSVADPSSALAAARKVAMTDAGERATQWAGLVGRQLGKVLSVSEVVSGQAQPSCVGGCGGAGGGTPIQAGQDTLTVSVTVTYELQT